MSRVRLFSNPALKPSIGDQKLPLAALKGIISAASDNLFQMEKGRPGLSLHAPRGLVWPLLSLSLRQGRPWQSIYQSRSVSDELD
ncbi:MAG: hypothetical protein HY717_09770 [Planctomycetes bacterium]|nr:hypothetical protein [Planctomycetota bacterium]